MAVTFSFKNIKRQRKLLGSRPILIRQVSCGWQLVIMGCICSSTTIQARLRMTKLSAQAILGPTFSAWTGLISPVPALVPAYGPWLELAA
jgi:hypothetical protein